MARMIPGDGPWTTGSKAEYRVYRELAKLDDDFTIIHSLPWITSAVRTIDSSYAPTGETDFIVLHPRLGILVIEVKGGVFTYDRCRFVYTRTQKIFDPVGQVKKGAFALAELIQKAGIPTTVGYAWAFPDSVLQGRAVPPALQDGISDERLYIDYRETDKISARVVEIMEYWRKALRTHALTAGQIQQIVDAICPDANYAPAWVDRIEHDNRTWLTLNDQQRWNLNRFLEDDRTVVTGRPGTGKTVLAMAAARIYASQGKKVLFLFFNSRIADKIKDEMDDEPLVDVSTFHALCKKAEQRLGIYDPGAPKTPEWFAVGAQQSLLKAIQQRKMGDYDAVLVDEGQVFRPAWYWLLRSWIKRIHVFCDETQTFSFEESLSNRQVEEAIDVERVGLLTVNMRSPMDVFRRLEISLPADYEQMSMRPSETDTLQEIVSFNLEYDLETIVNGLGQQGVAPAAIAILTSPSTLRSFEHSGVLKSLKTKVALIETSSKARGLEYPVVIVCGIDAHEHKELVNAYARATTRVIAIYHYSSIKRIVQDDPSLSAFLAELVKRPEVRDAVQNAWEYTRKMLGWRLQPVPGAPFDLFWNSALGAWVVLEDGKRGIAMKLWEARLLHISPYPIYRVLRYDDFATLLYISQTERFLRAEAEHARAVLVHCPDCGTMALQYAQKCVCVHCMNITPVALPDVVRTFVQDGDVVANPHKYGSAQKIGIGLHLIALAALERLEPENRDVILSHVENRYPGRNGYQALLTLVGVSLLGSPAGAEFANTVLTQRYERWVAPEHRSDIAGLISYCVAYWFNKGWLSKKSKGVYVRTDKTSPLTDSSDASAPAQAA